MVNLLEWLEDSIKSMEIVRSMLPPDNAGHIEALGRQKAYQEVIEKLKQEPTSSAK